ncbi:RICIN domain-containing protein [Actinoplanes sp. ATCC 53533]|uniref:RICIN domain-containing protein n=1 Tax=Actinoplanes sp. ATCC 53533 TaxID=1288362 RepID=UPI001F340307|nr:RICIN domain-containing protein [Actinoplanes sp. ATCC 53533]
MASGGGIAVVTAAAAEVTAALPNTIEAVHSGKCITTSGAAGPVTQQACATGAAARQALRVTPAAGGYTIAPLTGGGCLGVTGETPVRLVATCTGGAEQTFAVTRSGSGYAIKNVRTGKCVDVSGRSKANGASIISWACHSGTNQQWRLTLPASPSASPSVTPSSVPPSATPSATSATPTGGASPSSSPSATPGSSAPSAEGCGRVAGATPQVKVSEVNVGTAVTGYGQEGDTETLPMAVAASPDGGSWLAWQGTDSKVYLGRLDCDDKLVGTPTSFTGIDLQDVQADATGGVLLLTRRGDCRTGPLCGGSSSPCNTMHMIRFDTAGQQVWEQQVTNLTATRGGYDDGARFVWWYQHHGRLASDGANYAAYFGVAITVQNGACVDIHQGDRMQVVGPTGALLDGRGSFNFGCSHAWTSRIVWDPRANKFVMVCATDNNCRIAQPDPYRTVAAGTCDGTLFGGDLVLAKTTGYWTAWSQGGKARLDHFTTGASDTTITTAAATAHPHLVSYGAGRMLLAWESGSSMLAQVYDAGTAQTVGSPFTIAVRDHSYQAFKAYADGSAAYPAAGSTSTSIKIARVMPLAG